GCLSLREASPGLEPGEADGPDRGPPRRPPRPRKPPATRLTRRSSPRITRARAALDTSPPCPQSRGFEARYARTSTTGAPQRGQVREPSHGPSLETPAPGRA